MLERASPARRLSKSSAASCRSIRRQRRESSTSSAGWSYCLGDGIGPWTSCERATKELRAREMNTAKEKKGWMKTARWRILWDEHGVLRGLDGGRWIACRQAALRGLRPRAEVSKPHAAGSPMLSNMIGSTRSGASLILGVDSKAVYSPFRICSGWNARMAVTGRISWTCRD